ncbi:CPNE8 protein, partial [Polypterus senegalus]
MESLVRHITCIVKEHQLRRYGHVARFPEGDPARTILIVGDPSGWSRPRDHPRNTWLRQIECHFWRVGLDRVSAWGGANWDPELFHRVAASLPMSVIIIGVGPAEFDDQDTHWQGIFYFEQIEVNLGQQAALHIHQDVTADLLSKTGSYTTKTRGLFVPFRDYIDRSGNQVLSMARLAKDVLAEIPEQLLSFMKSRGIEPRPALPSSQQALHMRI